MKYSLIVLTIMISFCRLTAEEKKEYRDTALPEVSAEQSVEQILKAAFIALPQDYFEISIAGRVLTMQNHKKNDGVTLNEKKRTVLFSGDGAQGTILMTLKEWDTNKLVVRVDYTHENSFSEILTRTKHGWKVKRLPSKNSG
jgi:hypothetical protein